MDTPKGLERLIKESPRGEKDYNSAIDFLEREMKIEAGVAKTAHYQEVIDLLKAEKNLRIRFEEMKIIAFC